MSSINPVLLLPGALAERGAAIGRAFVGALTLGAGQFCTNPGLILAEEGPGLDGFLQAAAESLAAAAAATMLTPGIHQAYCTGVAKLARHAEVTTIGLGLEGATNQGQAGLFSTTATAFLAHPELQEEVFGAAGLVVRAGSAEELQAVVEALEGQLTAAVHFAESDTARLAGAAAFARKQGRPHPGQWFRHRRGGIARHGSWRPLSGDFGWSFDLRRYPSDPPLPAADLLPGHPKYGAARGIARRQPTRILAPNRWCAGQRISGGSHGPAHKQVLASACASCRSGAPAPP